MQNIEKDILTYVNTIVDKKADDYLYFYFSPKQSFLLLIKKKQPYILYSFCLLISLENLSNFPIFYKKKLNFKTVFTYR